MSEGTSSESDHLFEDAKSYGLEDRTFEFARRVRTFVRSVPRTLCNAEDAKQLVRSSGSVGANFIEATEALSSKDYVFRIRISRKEAKESRYWLRLMHLEAPEQEDQRRTLINEAQELLLILNSIVARFQGDRKPR